MILPETFTLKTQTYTTKLPYTTIGTFFTIKLLMDIEKQTIGVYSEEELKNNDKLVEVPAELQKEVGQTLQNSGKDDLGIKEFNERVQKWGIHQIKMSKQNDLSIIRRENRRKKTASNKAKKRNR